MKTFGQRLLGSALLRGSAVMLVSMTLVNAGNYAFNLIFGRWLGPAAFADLSLIVTLFLVMSFCAIAVQTPAAKFTAQYLGQARPERIASLRRDLRRMALAGGLVLVVMFSGGATLWQQFFSTASAFPFIIFGLTIPFYLLQAVERGVLQGQMRFGALAVSYQVEMWSRLGLGVLMVLLTHSVAGAVVGLGLSFVVTWLVTLRLTAGLPAAATRVDRRALVVFILPVVLAQLGQILINNSDVLIVRRFFPAEAAGQYAALALVGRIVFFATWSVAMTLFPMVVQRRTRGLPHRPLLLLSVGLVLAVSLSLILAGALFPTAVVGVLFGPSYLPVAGLVWQYAIATALYALANILVNYHLSAGNSAGTYLTLAFGAAQVVGLWLFHGSLQQVVALQIGLMAGLLALLGGWDLWLLRRPASARIKELA